MTVIFFFFFFFSEEQTFHLWTQNVALQGYRAGRTKAIQEKLQLIILMGARAMTRTRTVPFVNEQSRFMHSLIPSKSPHSGSVRGCDILASKCHNLQDTAYSRWLRALQHISCFLVLSLVLKTHQIYYKAAFSMIWHFHCCFFFFFFFFFLRLHKSKSLPSISKWDAPALWPLEKGRCYIIAHIHTQRRGFKYRRNKTVGKWWCETQLHTHTHTVYSDT